MKVDVSGRSSRTRSVSMRFAHVIIVLISISLVGCGGGGGSNKGQPPAASAGGPYTGYIGSAISFNAGGSSDPQGEVLTYAWNFGDGTTGYGVTPGHTYTAASDYTVSVTVTDTSGLSSTATTTASIAAQAPSANAGGPYTGGPNVAVIFDGRGSSDPQGETLTYAWNFGDGTTGNGVRPSHAYTAIGNYSVSLTVTNTSDLSSTATTSASIAFQPPVANAGGPYVALPNVAVTFNGSASSDPQGEALTYAWNFGDGATGTGVSPSHTYTAAENYPVSLAVTDTSNLSSTATTTAEIETIGPALSGIVKSGTQSVSQAHVHLFTANTIGYSQLSLSLLQDTGYEDSYGAYIPTGSDGSFSIPAGYYCPMSSQLYLYVSEGTTGIGSNSAIGMLTGVGTCGAWNPGSTFVVNEVTTIAAAYALAGFATDAIHLSSSGSSLAQMGVANAFSNAANLVDTSSGVARSTTIGGLGVVPNATINTLANILNSCTSSSGPSSTACQALFSNAKSGGSTGTEATDTATAAINIAHYPDANVPALLALQASSPPFSPVITSANDLTVALLFGGGALQGELSDPRSIAVDGFGNVWIGNEISWDVVKLSSSGLLLGVFQANGIFQTGGIAIDTSENAWITDRLNYVVELSNSGDPLSGTYPGGTAGGYEGYEMCMSQAIAIDGFGNAWVTQVGMGTCISNTIDEFSNSGVLLSGQGFTSNSLLQPYGIAIDGSGNAWMASDDRQTVTEVSKSGVVLSGAAGYSSPLLYMMGIAIDSNGNAWIAGLDVTDDTYKIVEYSQSGSQPAIYPLNTIDSVYNEPSALALDGAGNVWITNESGVSYAGSRSISELSSSGSFVSGSGGFTGGNQLSDPSSLAVDSSGNVWVTNGSMYCSGDYCNTVVEFIGAAVPVITPIAAGLPTSPTKDGSSKLATRP